MRANRWLVISLILLGLVAVLAVGAVAEKNKGDSGRLLTGRVSDADDNPLANAVVYLTNTRTRAIKTYICGADGTYRFPALSPNIDYEVYAQLDGHKSDTKTVSQFETRMQLNINLRIDVR